MTSSELIGQAAARLATVAGFVAFEFDRYQRLTGVDPTEDFSIPPDVLPQLALCRLPRNDAYSADLAAIGSRLDLPVEVLANFLRAVEAVSALSASERSLSALVDNSPPSRVTPRGGEGGPLWSGMLAAARDHVDEHTQFEDPLAGIPSVPGWLAQAAERFWQEHEPPASFPRDLDLPILLNLPTAIIEIDGLTVATLNTWLHRHRLPRFTEDIADRPLRGCLLAYAGIGIIFVDRADDATQRRLTLAHEASHFLIDYLLPRSDVLRRRPSLLPVLDGDREPTTAERFDAVLADVPIAFHAHLLERDTHGGHQSATSADVEDRAERLALELLAPLEAILAELQSIAHVGRRADLPTLLRTRFGLPAGAASLYARHLYHIQLPRARDLWEAIGLTERTATPKTSLEDSESAAGEPETGEGQAGDGAGNGNTT